MRLKLVFYELKKLFSFTYVKLILIVMLLLNIVFSYLYITDGYIINYNEYINKVYDIYEKSPEDYERAEAVVLDRFNNLKFMEMPASDYSDGLISDRNLFYWVSSFINADETYKKDLETVIKNAEFMRSEYVGKTDSYASFSVRYQNQVINRYERLKESVSIEGTPVYGWDKYFGYDAEIIFVLISVFACVLVLTLGDKTTGFLPIRRACTNGNKSTAIAKFFAMAILSFGIAVVFAISSLIVIASVYGVSDAGNAVQSVFSGATWDFGKSELMRFVPFNLSIAGFIAVWWFAKALVLTVFGAVTMLFASLFGSYLLGGACGGAFVALQFLLSRADVAKVVQWKYASIFNVYYATQFWTRYRAVNVFGFSIDLTVVIIVFFAVTIAASVAVCVAVADKNGVAFFASKRLVSFRRREKTDDAVKRKKCFRGSFSIIRYELKKNKAILILFAVLLIGKAFLSSDYFRFADNSINRIYIQYIEEIGGEYTDEKAKYINDKISEMQEITARQKSIEEAYINREITAKEFEIYQSQYGIAEAHLNVLQKLQEQSRYLQRMYQKDGVVGSYIFPTGFEMYEKQGADWLLAIFICLFSINLVLSEFGKTSSKGSVFELVRSTRNGRNRLFAKKLLLGFTASTIAYAAFTAVDMCFLVTRWKIPEASDLVVSMSKYGSVSPSLTFGGYFAANFAAGLAGVMILTLIISSAALLLHETISVYSVSIAVMVIPRFLQVIKLDFAKYLDPTHLFDTDRLFGVSCGASAKAPSAYYVIFFAVCAALSLALAFIAYKQIYNGSERKRK